MASNPDILLEWFEFSRASDRRERGPKASLRREPQPQAKGYDGHSADAAEPEEREPQQALRQRSRLWFITRQ
jgi:hypothetical protein